MGKVSNRLRDRRREQQRLSKLW